LNNVEDYFSRLNKFSSQSQNTIQKIYKETADISNTLSGRTSVMTDNISIKTNNTDTANKLKDKISSLVKHFDKDIEKPKYKKPDFESLEKNKNMLIINNNYEYDAPLSKNSYNSNLNFTSPKQRIELMTDKFFGPRSDKNMINQYDLNSNSRSNINNYLSVASKFNTKDRNPIKSDDISGLDNLKLNYKKCTVPGK
jgi:hypothetical protein